MTICCLYKSFSFLRREISKLSGIGRRRCAAISSSHFACLDRSCSREYLSGFTTAFLLLIFSSSHFYLPQWQVPRLECIGDMVLVNSRNTKRPGNIFPRPAPDGAYAATCSSWLFRRASSATSSPRCWRNTDSSVVSSDAFENFLMPVSTLASFASRAASDIILILTNIKNTSSSK
jgi:hypothetical protein